MKNKNNNKPLISIITVVYNGEKYLEQTIQSVINQTYKNIEYIVIDGGSTDGTLDIIKKYEKNISFWVSEPDEGLYDAMNKGIGIAKGDLIGMINSDDWYEPEAVETMANAYQSNPLKTIFHADRYNIDGKGGREIRKFHASAFKLKYYGMTFNHPSMFVTNKEYKEHQYNPNLKSHSDYQFVLETYLLDKNKFLYIEEALVNYRLDGISANINWVESMIDVFTIRRKCEMTLLECMFASFFTRIVSIAWKLKG